MSKKLGRPTDQRMAMLNNQVSDLLWYGRIETTVDRAKEIRRIAEKLLTVAINSYEDKVVVTKMVRKSGDPVNKKKDATPEEKIAVECTNDGPKKLAARRKLMATLAPLQERKGDRESRTKYNNRTKDVNFPLIEKMFNELAPKYARRNKENEQGGGYTRIIKLGTRRGDNAEMAIIELV